jgi:hypothetical protein
MITWNSMFAFWYSLSIHPQYLHWSVHPFDHHRPNTTRAMCSRSYRQYRCGHKKYGQPDYCRLATYSRSTGRWSMCGSGRSTIAVADPALCEREECYLRDLKRNGWTCCHCGEEHNRMDGCMGPPGGQAGDCAHFVCTICGYSYTWYVTAGTLLTIF